MSTNQSSDPAGDGRPNRNADQTDDETSGSAESVEEEGAAEERSHPVQRHEEEERPSPASANVEDLMEELHRLREEVTQLRARQTASTHASWIQRHPAWTVFLTTALGAAAGYAGSRVGASSDFSKATRKQLRSLAEQARIVAADVQEEIETLAPSLKQDVDSGTPSATNGGGKNRARSTSAGQRSAGAPQDKAPARGSSDGRPNGSAAVETVLRRVAGTASKARDSVRSSAKSATQDAAAQAVRTFASDDDLVPVEVKAQAAGMAATTLGAVLARKLMRSAGRIAASMLIAYLTKKVLDFVLRR